MKNLILIILLFVGLFCNAQLQELIGNTWNLEKLVIEGEEHLPPNNAEVNNITLSYVEGEYVFQTNVCSQLFIGAEFANNDSFWATSWYDEFQLCTENVNAEFEFNYLDNSGR